MKTNPVDRELIADKTCEIITVSLRQRPKLEAAARARQTTFESLLAAAIVGMIEEEIEGK